MKIDSTTSLTELNSTYSINDLDSNYINLTHYISDLKLNWSKIEIDPIWYRPVPELSRFKMLYYLKTQTWEYMNPIKPDPKLDRATEFTSLDENRKPNNINHDNKKARRPNF